MADNVEMAAPDLLRSAAKLIERAKKKLNVVEHKCGSCQNRVFENPKHARVFERITSIPSKLGELADVLEVKE